MTVSPLSSASAVPFKILHIYKNVCVCFPYLQPDTHTRSIPAQYGAMSALITNMCTLVCCLCFYICVR